MALRTIRMLDNAYVNYVKYLLSECKHHQIRTLRMYRAPCSYCTHQSNKILRNCHLLIEKTF